ncbi:hypothetical protein VTN49DRAFT_7880 [Thermomyces lanuginosus]|uniref:mitochondrial 54S ribosomal protein uL15m n=1 Tax=Thermomyces lanuginosus TaxID=5541 RepID=UPI0037426820
MPPRLPVLTATTRRLFQPSTSSIPSPFSSFLLPQIYQQQQPQRQQRLQQQQQRHATILGKLSDNPSAYNKRIRRGRGPASGKGKTSGRGHKGQKQHGKVPAGFTGGQTPEWVVHGKRGFENVFSLDISPVNLDRIQDWIDQGRIDPTRPITVKELAESRCIHGVKDGVKLLARGATKTNSSKAEVTGSVLKQPIHIIVSRASAAAIAAVEAAGGSVTTRYYTRASIKRILRRETHPFVSLAWTEKSGSEAINRFLGVEGGSVDEARIMREQGYTYRLPDPTNRKDIEYYRDPAHRGYLSHLVRPEEGPSLFFVPPAHRKSSAGQRKEKELAPNRLW